MSFTGEKQLLNEWLSSSHAQTAGLQVSPCDRSAESRARTVATEVMAGQACRKFLPLFDLILIERNAAETARKMSRKSFASNCKTFCKVAAGWSSKRKGGEIQPVSMKIRDKVLLEYGSTKVVLDDKDYFLFRDGDILGKHVD